MVSRLTFPFNRKNWNVFHFHFQWSRLLSCHGIKKKDLDSDNFGIWLISAFSKKCWKDTPMKKNRNKYFDLFYIVKNKVRIMKTNKKLSENPESGYLKWPRSKIWLSWNKSTIIQSWGRVRGMKLKCAKVSVFFMYFKFKQLIDANWHLFRYIPCKL